MMKNHIMKHFLLLSLIHALYTPIKKHQNEEDYLFPMDLEEETTGTTFYDVNEEPKEQIENDNKYVCFDAYEELLFTPLCSTIISAPVCITDTNEEMHENTDDQLKKEKLIIYDMDTAKVIQTPTCFKDGDDKSIMIDSFTKTDLLQNNNPDAFSSENLFSIDNNQNKTSRKHLKVFQPPKYKGYSNIIEGPSHEILIKWFTPEQILSTKRTSLICGLLNSFNGCFANSIIQALFSYPGFMDFLYRQKRFQPDTFLKSLQTLAIVYKSPYVSKINMKDFQLKFNYEVKYTFDGQQDDAHQFILDLFQFLELNREIIISPEDKQYLTDTISGILSNEYICEGCSYCFVKEEVLYYIYLAPYIDFNCGLSDFFNDEVVEYKCEKCNHNQFKKFKKITKCPDVIFFYSIKPPNFDSTINMNVKLVNEINIGGDKFGLIAYIIHVSMGKDGGHYTCVAKRGESWFMFNDDRILLVKEHVEMNYPPYLIFYSRL